MINLVYYTTSFKISKRNITVSAIISFDLAQPVNVYSIKWSWTALKVVHSTFPPSVRAILSAINIVRLTRCPLEDHVIKVRFLPVRGKQPFSFGSLVGKTQPKSFVQVRFHNVFYVTEKKTNMFWSKRDEWANQIKMCFRLDDKPYLYKYG